MFPKSWYSDDTSVGVQRMIVPAHAKCNKEFQRIEDELRVRLGLITVDTVEGAKGIREKALRAIDPSSAKNKADKDQRNKLLKRIQEDSDSSVVWTSDCGCVPNRQVETQHGSLYPVIRVRPYAVQKIVEKIVKGLTYYHNKLYISGDYEIYHCFLDDRHHKQVIVSELHGIEPKVFSLPPSLNVRRYCLPQDLRCGVYIIDLWQHFRIYASVVKTTDVENPS